MANDADRLIDALTRLMDLATAVRDSPDRLALVRPQLLGIIKELRETVADMRYTAIGGWRTRENVEQPVTDAARVRIVLSDVDAAV